MKYKYISYLFFISFLFSCEEYGVDGLIDFSKPKFTRDTTFVDLDTLALADKPLKNVLIEDFTGALCVNCPDAAEQIKTAKNQFPDRIVSMAIHAGARVFVTPKKGSSKYDFRTTAGDNLSTLLESDGNLPIGAVDRVKFEGEDNIVVGREKWVSYASSQLNKPTPVSIDIDFWNVNEDSFTTQVRVLYHEQLDDSVQHYLSVYVVEDSVKDYQKDINLGDIKDYKHDQVFRAAVTSYDGELMNETPEMSLVPGRVFQRAFNVQIEEDDPENEFDTSWGQDLEIVAVVHLKTAIDFEVLHVVKAKVE